MKEYTDTLRLCPLFRDIAPQEFSQVLGCLNAKISSVHKGEAVFHEGDPANDVGIVLTGKLQITRIDLWGNRSIIDDLTPGELFGESFAWAGSKEIPVTVQASEPAEVMLIDSVKIARSCGSACPSHQQMIFNLLQIVAAKNLVLHQKVEVISKRTTRAKLMTYLMLQAKQQHSLAFEIPFDRQELADYLEVERSGLSAEIGKLRRQGMIEADRRRFKLCKPLDT